MEPYSVLMSVYAGETPVFLRESIESMFAQTVPPDELLLVCDGPLTPALDAEIASLCARYGAALRVLRLPENVGIGAAANEGLHACRNELVFKMDADDVALPDRCERQLRCFAQDPGLAVTGGFIEEFESESGKSVSVRTVPETDEEIRAFARRRAPFNNQTLAYRKSAALACGGYSTLRRGEDYEFSVRLLQSGARAYNLQQVLVRYRLSEKNFARRKSWATTSAAIGLRWRMLRSGFSRFSDFLVPSAAQLALFLLPQRATRWAYRKFLRRGAGGTAERD